MLVNRFRNPTVTGLSTILALFLIVLAFLVNGDTECP